MTGIRNTRADVAFLAALSAAHPMHAAQLLAAGAGPDVCPDSSPSQDVPEPPPKPVPEALRSILLTTGGPAPPVAPEVFCRQWAANDDLPLTARQIIAATARAWDVTKKDICGPGRFRGLVRARFHAAALIRANTNMSLPEIGRAMGGRDHTTIIYALRDYAARAGLPPGYFTAPGANLPARKGDISHEQ